MEHYDKDAYIDDLIATSVEIDPIGMHLVQQKMNSIKNENVKDLTDRDTMLSSCVDEIIAGFDQTIMNQLKNKEVQQDFVWFEKPWDELLPIELNQISCEDTPKQIKHDSKQGFLLIEGSVAIEFRIR